jgi:hypothetical protein
LHQKSGVLHGAPDFAGFLAPAMCWRAAAAQAGPRLTRRRAAQDIVFLEKKQGAAGITTAAPRIAGQWGRGDNRLPELRTGPKVVPASDKYF